MSDRTEHRLERVAAIALENAADTDMSRILRDPKEIEETVNFSHVLDRAKRESDEFAKVHRITNAILEEIEFCI